MMKKTLLFSASLLLAGASMTAAVPEGNLYLMGLNGETAQTESNLFVLGERDQDDIDEGLWRWSIASIEVTEATGVITIAGADNFKLGYDTGNEFFPTNKLTNAQNITYLAVDGEGLNYDLTPGAYTVFLSVFEGGSDEGTGDTWMMQMKSLEETGKDESFYLIGFNDIEEPKAACRFVKKVIEDEEGTSEIYALPKYYIGTCETGFTVLDGGNDVRYGADAAMGTTEVTEAAPMAFLAADGEPVKSSLEPGYYDINFAPLGIMNMISFIRCEDQTDNDKLEYYLVGLNGVMEMTEANKFTRTVQTIEDEEEDGGEAESEDLIIYTLTAEVTEACELKVVSADGSVVFGYSSDMASFLPNDLNDTMPFTLLATGGPALNCTLAPGTYTFNFSLTDANNASISALISGDDEPDGAVDSIGADDIEPVYYNLQGQKVNNPDKGIFIEMRGTKAVKVMR